MLMQYTKWIRKNRQTIMTVVVIGCMLAFVGGYGLEELMMQFGTGRNRTIATYGDGTKIRIQDMDNAIREVEILKNLNIEQFLLYKSTGTGMPDISSKLLGFLLFSNPQTGTEIRNELHQYTQAGQMPVTTADVDAFFSDNSVTGEVYWILLSEEARKAGIAVSNADAARMLSSLIGQMTNNQASAAAYVQMVASRTKATDLKIIATFGKLMSIMKWIDLACDNESATLPQIRANIGRTAEALTVKQVKIPAEWFIDSKAPVSQEQIQTQFDKYKGIPAGIITSENPYGFGYLLPKRIQMEYFLVRNSDVLKQIEKPTAETVEEYYSSHLSTYQTQVPKDPNKPEGEKVSSTQSFAEVASTIYKTLEQERSAKLTQMIIKDARDILDAKMLSLDMEKATSEQLQQAAGDYQAAAAAITEKYKVPVFVGRTGLISQTDFDNDPILSDLQFTHSGSRVNLVDAFFAAHMTPRENKSRISSYEPRIWENVGPMRSSYSQDMLSTVICRVIDIQNAVQPTAIDTLYNTAGILLDKAEADKKVFDLKQAITRDIQKQSAMEKAGARAEELKQLIAKSNWDKAVDDYNAKYAPKDPNKVEATAFKSLVVESENLRPVSPNRLEQVLQVVKTNPSLAQQYQSFILTGSLSNVVAGFLGTKDKVESVSESFEFKPGAAWYVIKDITRKPANSNDYLQQKTYAAFQANLTDSVALGVLYLNPEQILKRMNYVPVKTAEESETQQQTTSAK